MELLKKEIKRTFDSSKQPSPDHDCIKKKRKLSSSSSDSSEGKLFEESFDRMNLE